jgi:hypothetical protein
VDAPFNLSKLVVQVSVTQVALEWHHQLSSTGMVGQEHDPSPEGTRTRLAL